nr:phospholipase-like protein [Tanacetum cinerariifolium]
EEFCLVTGLKFGVEYWADYNDEDEPIPFRRRVFPSSLDGILQLVLLSVKDRHVVPNWILRLANDRDGWDDYLWGSHVWPTLYYQLRNANVRRWLPLYATEPTNEVDKKSYSIFGFTWAFKTWILEVFREGPNEYYTRHRRYPRVVAWSSNKKFIDTCFGCVPAERLIPDEMMLDLVGGFLAGPTLTAVSMASSTNEARKTIVSKLQRELEAEATFANQLLCNLTRYREQMRIREIQMTMKQTMPTTSLNSYKLHALLMTHEADIRTTNNLIRARQELLRSITEKQNFINSYMAI